MKPIPQSAELSRLLGRVRQKDTAAELAVGAILRRMGLSYRKNVRSLPGSPDFANRKKGWAVFVQGCFWHHHTDCRRATIPKANREFWTTKFARNRCRDAAAIRALRKMGLKVVLVWECELAAAETHLSEVFEARGVDVPEPGAH